MEANRKIDTYTFTVDRLCPFLHQHYKKSITFGDEHIADLLNKHLAPELGHLRSDLFVLVEYPYVDKIYRDTYYYYYSSRLKNYNRNSIRVTFFDKPVELDNGIIADQEAVRANYLGFLILRPTFPKIIGRSAISPKALSNQDFVCCKALIPATAIMHKVQVQAFPHASQDGQALSCAETTIWALLEYFGHKYPEYTPLLPSKIIQLLQKFSFKRQVPSDGLTAEQIAYVIREVGFGAMIYSSLKQPADFPIALSMYIESGIPVIGVLKGSTIGHAVNIVGRQNHDRRHLLASTIPLEESKLLSVYDYATVERNFVFIDDNLPPYQLASIREPCKHYGKADWADCTLASIIVPLYAKIYLDPIRARKNFLVMLQSDLIEIPTGENIVLRIFLASSRSYKSYLAQNADLNPDVKSLILLLAMPKFIWVAELSKPQSFENQCIDGVMIQDATDPAEYTASEAYIDQSIFFGLFKDKYFTILDGNIDKIRCTPSIFPEYSANLT